MPMYRYRYTDEAGGEFEELGRMKDPALATHEGRPCERVPQLPSVRTQYGEGSHTDPIKMLSIAVDNEADVDDFRRRNPGTEISRDRSSPDFGVPVAKSRSEKLRVLEREGFMETN